MRPFHLAISTIVLLGTMAAATSVRATGYWNVPSNFCQCMNVGWGAGYHAPLVLGPIRCDGWLRHSEVRVSYPPSAGCSCYANGHCGCNCTDASRLESVVTPPHVPAPVIAPEPVSAIFAAPIEP
jgi:hypothetical protein